MFLPIEGLFAEVVRRPGLFELLSREYNIIVAGPTTLFAILTSLQIGFKTLAIEQRSAEVWTILGAVRTEFGKFGGLLDKVHKKIKQAGDGIDDVARKSRTIERKLRDVELLPASEVPALLGPVIDTDSEEEEE